MPCLKCTLKEFARQQAANSVLIILAGSNLGKSDSVKMGLLDSGSGGTGHWRASMQTRP